MATIFIRHATQDREFVEDNLIPLLRRHGIEVWYSKQDIQTSALWERAILRALDACDWFLIVLSSHSAQSEWVKDELAWAIDERQGRIIPVLIEDCDLRSFHMRMSRIQFIDCRDDLAEAEEKLVALLAGTDTEVELPPGRGNTGKRQKKRLGRVDVPLLA